MTFVEVGPKSKELQSAERVVGMWLTGLWATRPTWVNRMPDREDVDKLVNLIAAELEK